MRNLSHLLVVIGLSFATTLSAQDYTMFMTNDLDPAPGKALDLQNGVKAHNAKYHKEGNSKGYLWSVLSGPRSGKYVWGMGPMKWADMDEPMTDDHLADWEKNVAAHCSNVSGFRYMVRDDKRSYNPENQVTASMMIAKIFTVTGDRRALLDALWEISKVMKAKRYDQARRVYSSVLNEKDNQEVALIYPFESFKKLETSTGLPEGFQQAFEEINGFGSFRSMVVNPIQANSEGFYDEIRVLVE